MLQNTAMQYITDKLNIRCEDNMALMARYPDKYFDLAIVDPPYGINAHNGVGMSGKNAIVKGKVKSYNWDKSVPDDKYFAELFRVSKQQIIWGANYFQGLGNFNPSAKRLDDFRKLNGIVWDKGATMYGRDFKEAEFAFSSVGEGWIKLSPIQENRIHPTQKPINLYEWLLMNYAKPGDKILDTHLGSGSIAIACHNLGFELTACELDKDHYEAAVKRIKQHLAQLTIF